MSAIFDHLIAILVGAVLVGTLLFVQMRRQESAIETTVRNRVEWHADEFLSVLQRDVENMRTVRQTQTAFGFDRYTLEREDGPDGMGYTSQFSFPTLADPSLGAASPVAIVSYHATPTGQKVRVGQTERWTYTVTRSEYRRGGTVRRTGGAVGVLELNVMSVPKTGAEQSDDVRSRSDVAFQVRVSVVAAAPVGRRASDQRTTTLQNAVRRAATVRVLSATATEGLPPVEPGPAVVPTFPGDPPPPPVVPPPPPTSTGGGSPPPYVPPPRTNGGGSSPPYTPPPPMTPPQAPPGRNI
ncbi:MAG TPA: hypothetical protein VF594_11810 [Rubricoccaceae bacterium]